MNLLSYETFVETPFIIVKIGAYTFGAYKKNAQYDTNGAKYTVTYPNYMESLSVTKINGAINTYTINIIYPISKGDDPNLIEKILSSVSETRQIYISYGDWSSPSFIYRDEKAIITNVTSNVNFAGGTISYVIKCTSDALSLKSQVYDFPKRHAKPSSLIIEIFYNKQFGLQDIFKGMSTIEIVNKLIDRDDKEVDIPAKTQMNILDYLNFLVNCMESLSNTEAALNNAIYQLSIIDDIKNEYNGPYFTVKKIPTTITSKNSLDVYDIDVGYPGNNFVTNFTLNDNNTWSILYNYSEKINQQNYIYRINNDGKYEHIYSPNILSSNPLYEMTPAQKTWWTNVTKFPIRAELTLKGLLRPTMLMSYIKVHSYFYGAEYIASGLYIITKQIDNVSKNGYSTTLSLTRIGSIE